MSVDTKERKPQHFAPGTVIPGGDVCKFVGKPKRQRCMREDGHGTYDLWLVTMGFESPDGRQRKARYAQSICDTFTPGASPDWTNPPMAKRG